MGNRSFTLNTALVLLPAAIAVLLASSSLHADEPTLKIQSDPPVEVGLIGTLQVLPDGSVIADTDDSPDDFCPAAAGGTCEGVEVDLLSFTANNQASSLTLNQGQTITVAWNSFGARECEAGGTLPGWSGTKGVSGSQDVQVSSSLTPDTYTITHKCLNGSVTSTTGSITVQVNEFIADPGTPSHCDATRVMPSTWNRLINCRWSGSAWSGDCRIFEGVWPAPFMETDSGITRNLGVHKANDFIAIRFTTENMPSDFTGAVSVNTGAPNMESRGKLISISSCPGDFNEEAITAEGGSGCIRYSLTNNLSFGGPSTNRACKIQPNEAYYLNIVYTQSPLGTAVDQIVPHPDCNSVRCGNRFQVP